MSSRGVTSSFVAPVVAGALAPANSLALGAAVVSGAAAGVPSSFYILQRDASNNTIVAKAASPPSVTITQGGSALATSVTWNALKKVYVVSFTVPSDAAPYVVSASMSGTAVSLVDGTAVSARSLVAATILGSTPVLGGAVSELLTQQGLPLLTQSYVLVVGNQAKLILRLGDSHGITVPQYTDALSSQLLASVAPTPVPVASFPGLVLDASAGEYSLSFISTLAGYYDVRVTYVDTDGTNTPVGLADTSVRVLPGPSVASEAIFTYGGSATLPSAWSVVAGTALAIGAQSRDEYGNAQANPRPAPLFFLALSPLSFGCLTPFLLLPTRPFPLARRF